MAPAHGRLPVAILTALSEVFHCGARGLTMPRCRLLNPDVIKG